MALRFNGNSPVGPNPWSAGVGRTLGTATGLNVQSSALSLSARGGSRMACHLTYGTAVGLPLGTLPPSSWAMPSKAGAMASRSLINGSSTFTATAQAGQNLDAAVTGTGGVTDAPLGLIVSIAAALIGSGAITTAAANALASMVASITGSGNATATAAGLAALVASLSGAGNAVGNNTQLMDIAAIIRGYGDLTPEGIRDSVWNAVLVNYPIDGTAGKTLTLAGSGGVDYHALGVAVWAILTSEADDPGSIGAALQAGGGGGGTGLTLAQFLALK